MHYTCEPPVCLRHADIHILFNNFTVLTGVPVSSLNSQINVYFAAELGHDAVVCRMYLQLFYHNYSKQSESSGYTYDLLRLFVLHFRSTAWKFVWLCIAKHSG